MLEDIAEVMRIAYERNWITTRDGNCSMRHKNDNVMYITPSAVRKYNIKKEDLVSLFIFEEKIVFDEKASGELHMHWLLHKNSKETRSVLHLHPTFTVAAMYAGYDLQDLSLQFPEIHRYTKVSQNVPVLPAVSSELAKMTYNKIGYYKYSYHTYDYQQSTHYTSPSLRA